MGNALVQSATIQLKDIGGGFFGSKASSSSPVYSDDDYPAIPEYSEDPTYARFLDPSGAGNDSNDGTTWATAWATPAHALGQICAGNGKWLTCRDFTIPLGGVNLTGLGGNGLIGDPIVVRADPINGCIVNTTSGGIEFAGQNRWLIHDLTLPDSKGLLLANNSSGLTTKHITVRNCTGNYIDIGGASNVGMLSVDGGTPAIATLDFFGCFNCKFTGPGVNVNQNTALVYFNRISHYRIENNNLFDCVHPIKNKHYYTGMSQNTGFIRNNWCVGGSVKSANSYTSILNNVIDGALVLEDNGGGDNGCDFNTISHNTVTSGITMSQFDFFANNNIVKNNIALILQIYQYFNAAAPVSENISNYNLLNDNTVYNGASYDLAAWQNQLGQDLNSIQGMPTYTGGSTPVTVSGFELESGSLGKGASDSGDDIGANVATVGSFL